MASKHTQTKDGAILKYQQYDLIYAQFENLYCVLQAHPHIVSFSFQRGLF